MPPEPILEIIASLVNNENPIWQGSPTELADKLSLDMNPNAMTRKLNVNAGRLYNEYNIRYENCRTHNGRVIKLMRETVKNRVDA